MGFPIVEVSAWPVVSEETVGAEPKDWITPPDQVTASSGEHLWLYKPTKWGVRKSADGSQRRYRRSDDIAERLACALATLIGLPCAEVEFARRASGDGIISRNVTPDGWDIQGGDVILSEIPGYVSCAGDDRPKERTGHNLANISSVLRSCLGPPGPSEFEPAFGVFVGYLIFDAWIANTDRHALNWAVLERPGARRLAASFDHGSALASGIDDADLEERDPVLFSAKGFATRFEGGSGRTLVDLALESVDMAPESGAEWLRRLAAVNESEVRQ